MGWLGGEIISLNCCKCLQIKSTFFQAITARLRSETTLPLKWIVARVQFEYSYYGMYSRQLRGELDSLIADNLLVEKEGMNAYGGPSFTFEVQPKLEGFLDELGVDQEPAWTAAAKKLATARGVETYYTNLFSAPGAREAERHDDGSLARLTPVSLSAGSLHEKIEESRRLAASVQRSLYSTLAARSPDIRDRGIKDSAFVVLTGTTMPAVLTEISFVSSPADERNLQSASYRQQIAEALYQGIARYQQSSPRAKMAQLQNPAAR